MGKRDYSSEKHTEATGKLSVYLNIELQIISLLDCIFYYYNLNHLKFRLNCEMTKKSFLKIFLFFPPWVAVTCICWVKLPLLLNLCYYSKILFNVKL